MAGATAVGNKAQREEFAQPIDFPRRFVKRQRTSSGNDDGLIDNAAGRTSLQADAAVYSKPESGFKKSQSMNCLNNWQDYLPMNKQPD